MPRVGFYPRAAALFIDLAIFIAVAHFLAAVDLCLNEYGNLTNFGWISLGGGSLFLIAYSLLDVITAGTLGKKYMRLAIAAQDGSAATRRNLAERWLYKHLPVLVVATCFVLFALLEGDFGRSLNTFYAELGLEILAWADALVGGILTVFILAGCFAAMWPGAQAFHDRMAGTAVFSTRQLHAVHLFEPILGAQEPGSPQ